MSRGTIMRRALLACACLAWFAPLASAEALRTAVLDFAWTNAPGRRDRAVEDFSRVVQARLMADDGFIWVERQEFDRITREVDLGGLSCTSAQAAVRLGHWLRADLLLRGEIVPLTEDRGELRLEVIDLKRADTLATRALPLTLEHRTRIKPGGDDPNAVAAAALQALRDAHSRLGQMASLRVLAPLYFETTGGADRLGFIERQLTVALTTAAMTTTGFRVLQFPHAGDASEEASLVVAGLTDDAEAAQTIADDYVWGRINEEPKDGVAFELTPITIDVQVWSGAGQPQSVQWSGLERDVNTGIATVADGVLAAAKATQRTGALDVAGRRQLAQTLGARAHDVMLGHTLDTDFLNSVAGKQLYSYAIRLLETACFFDPNNRALQDQRLALTWARQNPLEPMKTLRGWWQRATDYRVTGRRFERTPDGKFDGFWPTKQAEVFAQIANGIYTAPWQIPQATMTPEEVYLQEISAFQEWGEVVGYAAREVAGESPEPRWLPRARETWATEFHDLLQHVDNPVLARQVIEKAWPVLQPEIGKRLKAAVLAEREPDDTVPVSRLYAFYNAFADRDRAIALLDAAWAAGKYESPIPAALPLGIALPAYVTAPLPPRADLPWKHQPPTAPAAPHLPPSLENIPLLGTQFRDVEFKPIQRYEVIDDPLAQRFRRINHVAISQFACIDGRCWLGETGEDPLPSALGKPNPQGNHQLWSFDPVLHESVRWTEKLGGHSPVTAILPAGGDLWLGFANDGVWQVSPSTGTVKRFTGEEGLASSRVYAGAQHGDRLYFLGGDYPQLTLSVYSLTERKWSAIAVPSEPATTEAAVQARARGAELVAPAMRLAALDDWLCVCGGATLFYDVKAGCWGDPFPRRPHMSAAEIIVPHMLRQVAADDAAFWLSGEVENPFVARFDPGHPEIPVKKIPLPGIPAAIVSHGPWLWLLVNQFSGPLSAPFEPNRPAQVLLVDKAEQKIVGRIKVPNRFANRLSATDDRVWVAGDTYDQRATGTDGCPELMEFRLETPRPSGEAKPPTALIDFPVVRAAVAGNGVAIAAALAAKADPDQASRSGWTPLMAAVEAARIESVRALLAAGANTNAMSERGETPLSLAAARGERAMAELLLDHGADPNLRSPIRLPGGPEIVRRPKRPFAGARPPQRAAQPKNVRASITKDGEIRLDWDAGTNEKVRYEIYTRSSFGLSSPVGQRPANGRSWIDHVNRDGDEFIEYVVFANNDAEEHPELRGIPGVTVHRPTHAPYLLHFRYDYTVTGRLDLPATVFSRTPLAAAAEAGHADVVDLLLRHGADVEGTDARGYTSLLLAVLHGHSDIVARLLKAGVNAAARADDGESAVSLAYRCHEDRELLEQLLSRLPEDERWSESQALVVAAAGKGQIADLEWLAQRGFSVESEQPSSAAAFSAAVRKDRPVVAEWILDHSPRMRQRWQHGETEWDEVTVIVAVVFNDRVQLFDRMLSGGFPLTAKLQDRTLRALVQEYGSPGIKAVFAAHESGTSHVAPMAAAAGSAAAKLGAKFSTANWSSHGMSVGLVTGPPNLIYAVDPVTAPANHDLLAACVKGDVDAAKAAVARGANVECADAAGLTPLILATKAQSMAVVKALVQAGASPHHLSKLDNTPLTFAVQAKNATLVEYLLSVGSDVNRHGVRGITPLGLACNQNDLAMVTRLLDAGADPDLAFSVNDSELLSPLAQAAVRGSLPMVQLLLERGANPLAQDVDSIASATSNRQLMPSLLMRAAIGGNVAVIKLLIAKGQDPRFTSYNGETAYQWAVNQKHLEAASYLAALVGSQP